MNLLFGLFLFELNIIRSAIETLLNSIPDCLSSFPLADSALGSVITAGLAALVRFISYECKGQLTQSDWARRTPSRILKHTADHRLWHFTFRQTYGKFRFQPIFSGASLRRP